MAPKRILIGGGARCGKSAFALDLARRLGPRRVFLATAEARDEEMRTRIRHHARERGDEFRTVEAPIEAADAILAVDDADVLVFDCVTFWLANLLMGGRGEEEILEEVRSLIEALHGRPFHTVLVTNEVGMGIVPGSPLSRTFRDVTGRAHQSLAKIADEIYFGALGMMLRLRPEPIGVVNS
jgi:adenosylcobinamide kinase/adenosylcobinamide-phosphate guanylyltransferase